MKSSFSFKTRANGTGLQLSVLCDATKITDLLVTTDWQTCSFEFDDTAGSRQIQIHMTGKLPEHTILDDDGNIIEDLLCEITDVELDGVSMGHMFTQHACYAHNYNNTGDAVAQQFFGSMGCNGTLSLNFTSPVYQWMLEHI